MKIGLLTTLYELNSSYSLSSVIESQMITLKKYGYEVVLFVHDNFKDDAKVPEGVEIRKVVPRFLLIDYSDFQPASNELEEQAKKVYSVLKENMKDIDVVFEHDMIFQGWFMPYCMAIHQLAMESDIKWFHWTHSVPKPPPSDITYPHTLRFKLPANSRLVYLNNASLVRAAEAYGLYPKDVRVVYNPVDPRLLWNLHPLVQSLLQKYPILEADLVQVYPLSTTRMVDGKQIKTVIEIFAHLKQLGKKVCLIVPNAHANDKREKQTIAQMRSYAFGLGLQEGELVFTSLEDPVFEHGVSRDVVSQLFQFSNIFIFPSVSENCPLILLEAMLAKCILVLNDDVHSMREFGKENALYFKFSGIDGTTTHTNPSLFNKDVAKIIIAEYESNRALKANTTLRQKFNLDEVYKKQILPLIHEQI